MAMWDIVGKSAKLPLYKLLGGAVRSKRSSCRVHGDQAVRRGQGDCQGYVEQGFTTLKTKAGRRADEDLEMVRGIRDGAGDKLKLRIDPNMGYEPAVALQLARDLEKYNLEYFEQPMELSKIGESAGCEG